MDILACLHAKHRSFTPESKLLWLKVGRLYGASNPVCRTIKELSSELSLGDRFVTRAICDSAKIQGVRDVPDFKPLLISYVASSRGRPKSQYMAAPWPEPSKTTFAELGEGREELIEQILFNVEKAAFKDRGCALSPANCLLLALLVSLAGACGEVRGVSRANLRAMTGMSNERLDNQLKKLRRLGFLFGWVGGGTGKNILGVTFGVYWVNLRVCGKIFQVDVSFPDESTITYDYSGVGKSLLEEVGSIGMLPRFKNDDAGGQTVVWSPLEREARGVLNFFEMDPGGRFEAVLQQALEEATAWVAMRILIRAETYRVDVERLIFELGDEERESFKTRYQPVFLPRSVLTKSAFAKDVVVESLMDYLLDVCLEMSKGVVLPICERYRDRLMGKPLHLALAVSSREFTDERTILLAV